MEFIHNIDNEQAESIKNMLLSSDVENKRLAIGILNNSNIKDPLTLSNILKLISDRDIYLYFSTSPHDGENIEDFNFYTLHYGDNPLYKYHSTSSSSVHEYEIIR